MRSRMLIGGVTATGMGLTALGVILLATTPRIPTQSPQRHFKVVGTHHIATASRIRPFVPVSASVPLLGLHRIPVQPESDPGGVLNIPPIQQGWGWWDGGAPAGSPSGPTILAGHVDWIGFGNGPAQKIWYLQPGMIAVVYGSNGEAVRYVAVALNTYTDTQMRTAGPALFKAGGPNRLYIITCGGIFIPAEHSWNSNVVGTFMPVSNVPMALHVANST
ncbi:MAG: class F sortase [Ferrimicrobium sp.]